AGKAGKPERGDRGTIAPCMTIGRRGEGTYSRVRGARDAQTDVGERHVAVERRDGQRRGGAGSGYAVEVGRNMTETDERLGDESAADGQTVGDFTEDLDIVAVDLSSHGLVDGAQGGLSASLGIDPTELSAGADRQSAHAAPRQLPDRESDFA